MTLLERLLDPAILGTLIPLVATVTLGAWLIARAWFRHQERMAMIDAGMHPDHPVVEDGREELELPAPQRRSIPVRRS